MKVKYLTEYLKLKSHALAKADELNRAIEKCVFEQDSYNVIESFTVNPSSEMYGEEPEVYVYKVKIHDLCNTLKLYVKHKIELCNEGELSITVDADYTECHNVNINVLTWIRDTVPSASSYIGINGWVIVYSSCALSKDFEPTFVATQILAAANKMRDYFLQQE